MMAILAFNELAKNAWRFMKERKISSFAKISRFNAQIASIF